MKKRLPEILCMAAVLVGLLALAAQARAEQTHRAYLYGYPDGTIRPTEPVTRAQLACVLVRLAETELPEGELVQLLELTRKYTDALAASVKSMIADIKIEATDAANGENTK